MTITRIAQTGLDLSQLEYESHTESGGVPISTSHTGGTSFTVSSGTSYIGWRFTNTQQVRGNFWFQTTLGISTSPPELFFLRDTNTLAFMLNFNGSLWSLYAGATLLATYSGLHSLRRRKWMSVGFDFKVHATTGWANVYFDGIAGITYSGQTNQGASQLNAFYLGNIGTPTTSWSTSYFDDFYLDDSSGEGAPAMPPLKRFYYYVPNADGNYSQWDGSDGNSVNNYALVDEIPPNEFTDYVTTTTSTDRDSYNMTTSTIGTGETVDAVIPTVLAANFAGGGTLKLSTRLGGVDQDSAAKELPSYWSYVISDRQTTKPGGGSWAVADIPNLEVGVTMP